ncbi:glycosyl transferase [Beggiatoa alba B18LD]|uniref:Glycosyl transferase n=1 Tax=Beggiatoa alba B18LD TaxID=395493 RepID=I3CCC9_9GAMM|nr:TIGR04283 family arsenosugar biosynthesis glycosyltransferase [Beggiatoa alba]EIJ41272.1 glycosyl transferase [Beggiatoa alba B18LD]
MSKLSIIIPTLNEAKNIVAILEALQPLRNAGHEVIIVDGDSHDETRKLAASFVDSLLIGQRGRAHQMNLGANFAHYDILLFLHADTQLPPQADSLILNKLRPQQVWGRFDVQLSGKHWLFRWIERLMNWRSRLTGIATGDQAIFVYKSAFQQVEGYPAQPLMEDIALSKRLKCLSAPICLSEKVTSSSRRWEQKGIIRTIFLMWYLRLAYWLGANPKQLKQYYDK